jgi:hypothetical protein
MDDQRSDGSRWLTILLIVGAGVVSAFQVGKARTALGCNPEALSELLPAPEAGLSGVVRRPRSRIIAPTLTTVAYRSRRIAAGHR